jgi:hypothetical protein
VVTLFTAVRILLEDLVVFLSELYDGAAMAVQLLGQVVEAVLAAVESGLLVLAAGATAVGNGAVAVWEAVHCGLHSLALFFNLLGRWTIGDVLTVINLL